MIRFVKNERDPNLAHVAQATAGPSFLLRRCQRWNQQRSQDGYDGNDDQQFNQGECTETRLPFGQARLHSSRRKGQCWNKNSLLLIITQRRSSYASRLAFFISSSSVRPLAFFSN